MTLMQEASLFDGLDIPPRILPDDNARTGRNMPISSHKAGDRSQRTISKLRPRVLVLVRENPFITGAELNELYLDTYKRRGWDQVSPDSPRKRAGEMADSRGLWGGLLLNQSADDEDARYIISAAGLDVIAPKGGGEAA